MTVKTKYNLGDVVEFEIFNFETGKYEKLVGRVTSINICCNNPFKKEWEIWYQVTNGIVASIREEKCILKIKEKRIKGE